MNLRLEPTALRLRVSPWLCFSVAPLGPTTSEPFAPEALYELKVDTNGDLVAEIAYRVRFAPAGDGALTATVRRVEGPDAAGRGEGGEIIVQGAPVSTGREAQVMEAGAYRFFAGWRSAPHVLRYRGHEEVKRRCRTVLQAKADTLDAAQAATTMLHDARQAA